MPPVLRAVDDVSAPGLLVSLFKIVCCHAKTAKHTVSTRGLNLNQKIASRHPNRRRHHFNNCLLSKPIGQFAFLFIWQSQSITLCGCCMPFFLKEILVLKEICARYLKAETEGDLCAILLFLWALESGGSETGGQEIQASCPESFSLSSQPSDRVSFQCVFFSKWFSHSCAGDRCEEILFQDERPTRPGLRAYFPSNNYVASVPKLSSSLCFFVPLCQKMPAHGWTNGKVWKSMSLKLPRTPQLNLHVVWGQAESIGFLPTTCYRSDMLMSQLVIIVCCAEWLVSCQVSESRSSDDGMKANGARRFCGERVFRSWSTIRLGLKHCFGFRSW